jgi:hypothetical protein
VSADLEILRSFALLSRASHFQSSQTMQRLTREDTTVLNIAGVLGIQNLEWVRSVYRSCGRNENEAFYRLEQVRLAVDVQSGVGREIYISLLFLGMPKSVHPCCDEDSCGNMFVVRR